uniref:Liprin-beta-1/2 coiled-coil domain-containing protein n=1 Tax=Magallana gigas TaxID=29159 RepID=A0A8W8NB16_MAGGI
MQELLTRTSLETHKLDLMAEISSLKIKLASADKDRRDLDDRLRLSQSHLRLRDPKTTSASSSPEKSPGIESDDSLSSASSSSHRQAAYRKRSLRHRRSEDTETWGNF